MINLTINGKKISVEEGTTILEAALQNGINIPHLCYDRRLRPYGACRLCVVEAEGQGKLLASCSTPATEGMVISTETPKLRKARQTVLELLLIHHPLDCPICDKAGECELQDLAFKYGSTKNRFKGERKHELVDTGSPIVERNTNRCILCGKCVRVCNELQGVGAINILGRGFSSKISPAFEETLDCEFCGQCIDACPVGALGSKPYKFSSRVWFLEEHDNICPYCSVGCTATFDVRDGKIIRARGVEGKGINQGSLCVKGRFGFDYIYSKKRLKTPLIKEAGTFRSVSWEEALDFVSSKIQAVKNAHGSESIGAIGSSRCTVEDNYMLKKFMTDVIGSNNIDSLARVGFAKIQLAVEMAFGLTSLPTQFNSPVGREAILVIESDITSTHPVWGLNFLKAKLKGSTLITADTRETKLTRNSSRWLRIKPASGTALLNGIMKIAIDEGLYDKERASTVPGFSSLSESLNDYTAKNVSEITGITEDEIISAARTFLKAKTRLIALTIGASEDTKGLNTALAAANLIILTGEEPSSLQMPGGYCNTFGMWQSGLTENKGKDVTSMLYTPGDIRALYIMGENPVLTFPDASRVEKILKGLDFLIVQDIMLTETAELANVVLPASSWSEKDGTFINAEGIKQSIHSISRASGEPVPDWQITRNLARVMGFDIGARNIISLQDEISSLEVKKNPVKLNFNPVRLSPDEETDEEYPVVLITGNLMQHSGALSVMSRSLSHVLGDAFLQINAADAERYNVKDESFVQVSSRRGSVFVKARVSEEVPEGSVFLPIHFPHAKINTLTRISSDGDPPINAVKIGTTKKKIQE